MQPKWEVNDVLSFIDGEADEFKIPRLGVNKLTGDLTAGVCLHVFSSERTWLLTFEQSIYWTIQTAFANLINGVSPDKDIIEPRYPLLTTHYQHVWHDGRFVLDPYDVRIKVNKIERAFAFTDDDYRELGIDLRNPPPDFYDPQKANIALYVLRLLERSLKDEIYAKPDEMLSCCKMTDFGLRHLLTLHDYYHPPYPQMPSETETFQMIAEVLVSQDPTRYHPSEPPNTRWQDWPFDRLNQ